MIDIDDNAVSDVLNLEARKRQVLKLVLGELRKQADHHLAIRVNMGDVDSYVTSVPLLWIADKVGFAADLPIFKESTEGSRRIAVNQATIDLVQQRQPDWRRQQPMTAYLAAQPQHKFPPLFLVAYQHWVYEPDSDRWAPDGTALHDSLTLLDLEPTGTYWDLDDSDTRFYALDGQHRLMAILGLQDLIRTGNLHALDEKGKQRNQSPLLIGDLIQRLQDNLGADKATIHERMQLLMDERIGVEIVPAVTNGETFDRALRRLRQLFVDVNEQAKSLTKSEIAQLDENNGFKIVARRLIGRHPLLCSATGLDSGSFDPVHMKSVNLSEKSSSYTTLDALCTVVERYLVENRKPESVSTWQPLAKGLYQRPDDESLEVGTSAMVDYFDAIARLPSHKAFIQGKPAGDIRSTKAEDNILFRPIAQTALAEAVGKLSHEGISVATVARVLTKQEKLGQLRLTDPRAPWFGVLCDPVARKVRRHKRNEKLCCQLFVYLLGGGISDDVGRAELLEKFVAERRVDDDRVIDINGAPVEPKEVDLPNPWN